MVRYYDPTTGTFSTRDPIESRTREPYEYAASSPLNLTDPSGLWVAGLCGNISVGFVAYGSIQGCMVSDGHGDMAILPIATGGASSPTASATAGFMYSNAETVEDLRGLTTCAGGGGGEGLVGGIEACFGLTNEHSSFQFNGVFSVYLGGGLGLNGIPFAEGHLTLGYTGAICLPDVDDLFEMFVESGGGRVSLPPVGLGPLTQLFGA